jgi:hypothetical protein
MNRHLGRRRRPARRWLALSIAAVTVAATTGALLAGGTRADTAIGTAPAGVPPPHDPRGQRACDGLLDPQDKLLTIRAGMTDGQVGHWGGEIHRIATAASGAASAEVAAAGEAILGYMPDLTFEVQPLWELAVSLAEACVASGLSTGQQLHDTVAG